MSSTDCSETTASCTGCWVCLVSAAYQGYVLSQVNGTAARGPPSSIAGIGLVSISMVACCGMGCVAAGIGLGLGLGVEYVNRSLDKNY